MKKIVLLLVSLFIMQNICLAKDILQFDFPNAGWHKVPSKDGVESKKCYVPANQSAENYTEMMIFTEKSVKTAGITPLTLLQKQLGKDKNNYKDAFPEYIKQDFDNAMALWCSEIHGVCTIQRAFQGNEGVVLVTYINKMPHYSHNIITNKVNIIGNVKIFDKNNSTAGYNNLIRLD